MTVPLQPTAASPDALTTAPAGAAAPMVNMPTVVAPLPPAPPMEFPLGWMLEHAALPLRYRAIADVAHLSEEVVRAASWMPYAHRPALVLALAQHPDGTWGGSMLGVPKAGAHWPEGVGTIQAVRRLLEYGWDRESPPLQHARRLLFRLLAEDDDPAYLFEFAADARDEEMVRRGRLILREAAAATLAQAGYERDPRLRGAALRILERVGDFVRSPDAQKPWVRVGNKQVLPAEAAPPSIYSLTMLAHMPLFCSEHGEVMDRLYDYVSQPLPRQEPVQVVGDHLVEQPHLVLGDPLPHRNAADADVPTAVAWLELMARLNFLRRCEHWVKLYERFLDDRDRDGVWHPHKGDEPPHTDNPFVWPAFPLGQRDRPQFHRADVTFRLGLIARLSGRAIELT
ncbi:MAG TPA: hypothetical protein VFS08_16760 [Gemmatimonadaceae bacterium]|nr:hypothetical protein [Gemmatimonadaceae bacterium]